MRTHSSLTLISYVKIILVHNLALPASYAVILPRSTVKFVITSCADHTSTRFRQMGQVPKHIHFLFLVIEFSLQVLEIHLPTYIA